MLRRVEVDTKEEPGTKGEADDGEPGPLPEKMGLGDEEVAEDATTPGKHARKVSIIAEQVREEVPS